MERVELARRIPYYEDKVDSLRDIFGATHVEVEEGRLRVDGVDYPIVDDVIILLEPSRWPASLRRREAEADGPRDFPEDIQFTFGEEWKHFPSILPEHEAEFRQYFDIVPLERLRGLRVCDLGCGIGRWSNYLKDLCKELVLVDFSDAVFVARGNLRSNRNVLFFLGDLRDLPFRVNFADLVFCLGVLHHLPDPALLEVRRLRRHAPRVLVYLYYALDNRPPHYRLLLAAVTKLRLRLARSRNTSLRHAWAWAVAVWVYLPLVVLGRALRPLGLAAHVPLAEGYTGKTLERITQDAYDRFFTRIEQRVTREAILGLRDTYQSVVVSDRPPYWHFLCESTPNP